MISNHKLTPTEEMILYILLIEEKEKGSYGLRYKIFQEKSGSSDSSLSEGLKNLIEIKLIKKENDSYFLTDEGRKKASEIRKNMRKKIKNETIDYFIKDEKFEKMIYLMIRDYLKFPFKNRLEYFFKKYKKYSAFNLLKKYIVFLYTNPFKKFKRKEFINKEECIEFIKNFWKNIKKEDYYKEYFILKKGFKINKEFEYIKKIVNENIYKIFKEFHEFSKDSNSWIEKRNIKIPIFWKIILGGFNGILSSFLAFSLLSPFLILFDILFPLEIKIIPNFSLNLSIYLSLLYIFFIISIIIGLFVGIPYAFSYEEAYYKEIFNEESIGIKEKILIIIAFILLMLYIFSPCLISIFYPYPFIEIPFFPPIPKDVIANRMFYISLFHLLYLLLFGYILIHLWDKILKIYFKFHQMKKFF